MLWHVTCFRWLQEAFSLELSPEMAAAKFKYVSQPTNIIKTLSKFCMMNMRVTCSSRGLIEEALTSLATRYAAAFRPFVG